VNNMSIKKDLMNNCQMLVDTKAGYTLRLTYESGVFVLSMLNEYRRSFVLVSETFKPQWHLYNALIKLQGGII